MYSMSGQILAVAAWGISICLLVLPTLTVAVMIAQTPRPTPPARLGTPLTTARGRACHIGAGALAENVYVINPTDHGADPTGVTDSTAALQLCVDLLWNASRPGGVGTGTTGSRVQ